MSKYQLQDGVLTVMPGTDCIQSREFASNQEIRKVILLEGVCVMEDECFAGCGNLEEVFCGEGLVNLGIAAFGECTKLRKIHLPQSIRSIDSGALMFCESLTEITLPEKLETIGEMAFQNTGLIQIMIPEGVHSIGEMAFFSCDKLKRVDILGKQTEIGQDAFGADYQLVEGYIAPGYPEQLDAASKLLYSMLVFSCPEKHTGEMVGRASDYVQENQIVVMERILKTNNITAVTGMIKKQLFDREILKDGLTKAIEQKKTEITAILMLAQQGAGDGEEFEL